MLTKNDILQFLGDNKDYLSTKFHIVKIGLFGSFARDEAVENSDIDLIIELEENTPDIFSKYRIFLTMIVLYFFDVEFIAIWVLLSPKSWASKLI